MARGKILIKRIEHPTNRQVTYSKRKNGIFKKARELAILCDARVSIIMFSGTRKLHEFVSPSTTMKQVYDDYQKALGVNLWSSHYERMQEDLKKLQDTNRKLRKAIRQRMGESLGDLSLEGLRDLQQDMESSVKIVRDRKYQILGNQIETGKKKLRNAEEIRKKLLREFDVVDEDPFYGLVENGGDYESVLEYASGDPRSFALRWQPAHPCLHSGTGSDLTHAQLE